MNAADRKITWLTPVARVFVTTSRAYLGVSGAGRGWRRRTQEEGSQEGQREERSGRQSGQDGPTALDALF